VSGPADARSLAALAERARDPSHAFTAAERATLADLRAAVLASDAITVTLGGRGGRLGETVVATALLEGFLLALVALGKVDTPLRILVDGPAIELFDTAAYRARHWPAISVAPLAEGEPEYSTAGLTFALDLHGAHDGPPSLREDQDGPRRAVTCASLFRVGVREYAARGPLRRYADCLEDLLTLPPDSLDGRLAQPTLRLPADDACSAALAGAYDLRPRVPLVVGCFQSAVVAKCYGHWRAVVEGISAQLATRRPGADLDLLIACGPDGANPPGARYADLAAEFAGYRGSGNLRVVVAQTETLADLACCLTHAALALTNDSAPGHIASALGIPVVTPYLPGGVYSLRVWASSLMHRGVTSDASFTRQQVENAVLWDHTDVIDSIAPERLVAPAMDALAAAGLA
jgi:hypothetical protein